MKVVAARSDGQGRPVDWLAGLFRTGWLGLLVAAAFTAWFLMSVDRELAETGRPQSLAPLVPGIFGFAATLGVVTAAVSCRRGETGGRPFQILWNWIVAAGRGLEVLVCAAPVLVLAARVGSTPPGVVVDGVVRLTLLVFAAASVGLVAGRAKIGRATAAGAALLLLAGIMALAHVVGELIPQGLEFAGVAGHCFGVVAGAATKPLNISEVGVLLAVTASALALACGRPL